MPSGGIVVRPFATIHALALSTLVCLGPLIQKARSPPVMHRNRAQSVTVLLVVLLVVLWMAAIATALPSYQACQTSLANSFPYCDTHLTFEARVLDLLGRLTLDEKISLVSPDPDLNICTMVTRPVPRLGLPAYMWLTETNTGVASQCVAPGQCATTFPGEEGMGATFNRSLWYAKGDVISTELRAFNNINWPRGVGPQYLIGLDGFGPNINMVRDPRFGRNSELPGEDPLLTGEYAAFYISGIQQVDSAGYIKMLAYVKHYDAYSVETNRGHDSYNISVFDFFDTYLPQFQRAFQQGHASGLMCSYNAENGVPSCANGWLLNDVVRGLWQQPDTLVMSDCGALSNLLGPPASAPSEAVAAAWALNNGTDLEAGSTVWGEALAQAIRDGLTSEAALDRALRRSLLQLMRAGHFDPPANVSWTRITADAINSSAHQQLNYEAALQSFVLLKNEAGMLPLATGRTVAVVGPQAVAQYGLLPDYFGDQVCYDGGYDCIPTIGNEVSAANVGGRTLIAKGVDVNSTDTSGVAAALAAVREADVVLLVLGIDKTIEYETHDRDSITLPGLQEWFAQQVLAVGKPTALVLTNGGALAIDNLMAGPQAIVEAFNPSLAGARALAATLFGRENRWGRLPITLYPADYVNQVAMTDFDMSRPPGRTYRYYTGRPLWPFGFGLSYSTFSLHCAHVEQLDFTCLVSNEGPMDGDVVLLVFHSVSDAIRHRLTHPVPLRQLVGFERVHVPLHDTVKVQFSFQPVDALGITNSAGQKVVYPGEHTLAFSQGSGADVVLHVTA